MAHKVLVKGKATSDEVNRQDRKFIGRGLEAYSWQIGWKHVPVLTLASSSDRSAWHYTCTPRRHLLLSQDTASTLVAGDETQQAFLGFPKLGLSGPGI